jgi:hypothetical protein
MAILLHLGCCFSARAQFETRALTTFPQGAYSTALGDFNNDGKLDVVMITGNGFSVALGNGDGTFQAPITYKTALSYSLAVGDINNDGNLDIVLANDNLDPSTVSVYLGLGNGKFLPPIVSNTTSYNEFIAVGDFNNDGKLDIVLIENPYVSVLLGNGDGTFQPPSDNGSFLGAKWLSVADFNNDGHPDVVVTGYFGATYAVGVLLGNGDGTLQDSITQYIEYIPGTIAAGDLNGDGKMDAVLGYDLSGLAVFLGNGDGTLQPPVNYDTTGISYYVSVHDFNLDGRLDVAVPAPEGSVPGVDLFWGNGDGTLQPAQFFASAVSGIPAIGDLNGDHLPDFALGNSIYGVETMLNTGSVSFSPSTAPLLFPVQPIGSISAKQTVKLTNNGISSLSIASMKVSGSFQMSNTCGQSVASGQSCSISAWFKSESAGTFAGLVTIRDSASSKPQFIELTGSATVIKLSPTNLKFGDQSEGTKSAPKTVTATNQGTAPIRFSSVGLGQQAEKNFSVTETCTGHVIQPGASCSASVTFAPTKKGSLGGDLDFTLPAGAVSPAPLALSGTGT